jgi:hypothetical protein
MAEIDKVLSGYVLEMTPSDVPDFENVRAKARHRSRTRVAAGAVGAAAVVATGFTILGGAQQSAPDRTIVAITAPAKVAASPSTGGAYKQIGALPEGGAAWCVDRYSPQAVAKLAVAFDGTVIRIGPGPSIGPTEGKLTFAAVTFTVNGWFRGGASPRMTVNMTPPTLTGADEVGPSYRVGSRLLVSGEPRTDAASAKGVTASGCGFTRYFDAETAAAWRQAMG